MADERFSAGNILKYQKNYDTYRNLSKTSRYFKICVAALRSRLNIPDRVLYTADERKKRMSKHVCDSRRRKKIRAIKYKGGKCQNCGYKNSVYSLSFHHVNPDEKDFTIAAKIKSWDKIQLELDKCVLVCNNCHGEIHEELFEKGSSDIVNKIIGV